MPFLALPNELILNIARRLLRCPICHCHHISRDLSALSRSNHRTHALLAEYLLTTASPLPTLLWAIVNSRPDTVALALERGADPNTTLRHERFFRGIGSQDIGTPIDVAIRMRVHSADAESHAVKLTTLALLFAAGGTCTYASLINPTRYGDLDVLTICLAHVGAIDPITQYGPQTLLAVAARHGHVEAARMAIRAGAAVNSTGAYQSAGYYPPLWLFWDSSIAVMQVILDEGADATWRSRDGVSLVQRVRRKSPGAPEAEAKVALLVRHGAVDEPWLWPVEEARWAWAWDPPYKHSEYRGWMPGSRESPVDWAQKWKLAERDAGCGCLSCPDHVAGGRLGRALIPSDW